MVEGSGVWRIDGREVPVRAGTSRRFGMTFIAVGARRGSYEPRGPF